MGPGRMRAAYPFITERRNGSVEAGRCFGHTSMVRGYGPRRRVDRFLEGRVAALLPPGFLCFGAGRGLPVRCRGALPTREAIMPLEAIPEARQA